jgi:hypothetical protein
MSEVGRQAPEDEPVSALAAHEIQTAQESLCSEAPRLRTRMDGVLAGSQVSGMRSSPNRSNPRCRSRGATSVAKP